jgi:hypothetical protein
VEERYSGAPLGNGDHHHRARKGRAARAKAERNRLDEVQATGGGRCPARRAGRGWRPDAIDPTKSVPQARFFRKRRTLDSPQYVPVLLILIVMAIGSVGAFFILPPLLDRIDRVGKVGIFGF